MNGYFIGAVVALLATVFFWWQRREAQAKHRGLLAVEASTTGSLHQVHRAAVEAAGAGAFSERVELSGTTAAGPGGLLTSPLSETPCVWHKHVVTRRYRKVSRDTKGDRQTSTAEERVTDEQSNDVFVLRDADGEVLVKPSKGSMSGTRKSVSRFEESDGRGSGRLKIGGFEMSLPTTADGDTLGYEYDEWVLLPDVRVFVAGEATDTGGGELVVRNPRGGDNLMVTTRSEDEVIDAASSGVNRNLLFAAGTAALAVVLVVLGATIG